MVRLLMGADVLMVWHAYLLAPRSFLEDCLRQSKMDFWATGLPWEVIESCFDASDNYQPGIGAKQFFDSRTGVCWDNLMDSPTKIVLCPKDGSKIVCPWMTYADSHFREACPTCSTVLTHDVLSVHRLRQDADDFMLNNHPMPGTVLSSEGIPHSPSSISRDPSTFPNRFIEQGGFMTRIATMAHSDLEPSMEDIRDWIQGEIERGDAVRKANNRLFSSKLGIEEEAALGRMLNCYWDDHSSFSTNLATAVLLRGDYVDKMNQMMWLKEKSLNGRLWRGLQKFDRVFQIMKKYPQGKVVPTLDIQLAWDTYLLSPQSYYFFSIEMTRKLVDYTQKVVGNGQHGSLEWTKEMYLKLFGEKYGDNDSQPYILGIRQEKERDIAGIGRWGMTASFPVASMEPY
jgi:Glycine-rich domain-containing protein-like